MKGKHSICGYKGTIYKEFTSGEMDLMRITGEQAKALHSWLKRNSNILKWGEL